MSWHVEDEGGTKYNLIANRSNNEQSVTVEILSMVVRELPSWKSSIFAKADKTIVEGDYKRETILSLKSRNFPTIEKGFIYLSKEMCPESNVEIFH